MNAAKFLTLLFFGFLFLSSESASQRKQIDRQPAVAGQFYPPSRTELQATLKLLYTQAVASQNIPNVLAIISPHAGYVCSGEVAASSFNQIDASKEYENIFILGSSHHIAFDGASIYSQGNFITPLQLCDKH